MKYEATGKYLRISTRKMRLVADAIRPLPVHAALTQLERMAKRGGDMLAKVFKSAVANAKGRNVDEKLLRIERIDVMEGPVMKRWHAVSRGMAHAYKKRMTHVRVVLTDEATSGKQEKNDRKNEGKKE